MKQFVGIDLGTTNSAICSYDGENVRIWKSPEQNDVTPSAISYDKRGNRYVGKRAYDSAPQNPKNAALLFKRLMGTKTQVHINAIDKDMTPEECSAEVLKVLYGYLPEEVRNDSEVGTVITVPAAFNQMQKTATMDAAKMAGIGKVALMQESVAAVMSVMRVKQTDGMFLIYDFGGGTLDVAIAESIGKKVNLLAHGGIAVCGGRDFDRGIFNQIVRPWLDENFKLPSDMLTNPAYESLHRLSLWAAEKAKIELSGKEESRITLTEFEIRTADMDGNEIYLDIPLTRDDLNSIIEPKINESVEKVLEVIQKNNLHVTDFENIVFIGGPSNYKPLRDKVSEMLSIPGVMEVNPMTTVAEGAAVYAESIDWASENRHRKDVRGQVKFDDDAVSFNYIARTSEEQTKFAVQIKGSIPAGMEFQVNSLDTGWTSGRVNLENNKIITLSLSLKGENKFKISVFDQYGSEVKTDQIVIDKISAIISAIPASHSVGVEIQKSLGSRETKLDWLIRAGDHLPKKGQRIYKATQVLKANSTESLNFKLWEGEIEEPVSDNRFIGVFSINGRDLVDGIIPSGADLVCDYEVLDSGNITIEVSVPQIGSSFKSERNFYSRQAGAVDFSSEEELDALLKDGDALLDRIEKLETTVNSEKLQRAREKVESALNIAYSDNPDTEPRQEAAESIYEAKRLLYEVKKENIMLVRKAEMLELKNFYEDVIHQYVTESEDRDIQTTFRRAQTSIQRRDSSFDGYIEEIRSKFYGILWAQDWYIIDDFKYVSKHGNDYIDTNKFNELVSDGMNALSDNRLGDLRKILIQIYSLPRKAYAQNEGSDFVNIMRG